MRNVIHTTMQILFPPRCGGCGAKGVWICDTCVADIRAYAQNCFFCEARAPKTHVCAQCAKRYALEAIVWPWRYSHEKTHKVIGDYKYKGLRGAAPALAKHLEQTITQLPQDDWHALPIPIHKSKERERGFNQSYLIARELGLPLINRALVRTVATPPQARSDSRKARFESIRDAFEIRRPQDIEGKAILLIDDVATTGATLSEAARLLKHRGARRISAAVLAHG
ncbi:MAG: phosphoribosyltransferase family protein [Patescibacteria group bacterium]